MEELNLFQNGTRLGKGGLFRSDTDLHIDTVAVVQTQCPSEMILTDDLDRVNIMGPFGNDNGALDIADLGLVCDDISEASSIA